MKIAVLSSNFSETLMWMKSRYEITELDIMNRRLKDENGHEYIIVQTRQQVYDVKFDNYIKAPDFETLEDVVRKRI